MKSLSRLLFFTLILFISSPVYSAETRYEVNGITGQSIEEACENGNHKKDNGYPQSVILSVTDSNYGDCYGQFTTSSGYVGTTIIAKVLFKCLNTITGMWLQQQKGIEADLQVGGVCYSDDTPPPPPPISCADRDANLPIAFKVSEMGGSLYAPITTCKFDEPPVGEPPEGTYNEGCGMQLVGTGVCMGLGTDDAYCKGVYEPTGGTCKDTDQAEGYIPERLITPDLSETTLQPLVVVDEDGKFESANWDNEEILISPKKEGNCGTFNGERVCFPLVESKQPNSDGKDLKVKPSTDTTPPNAIGTMTTPDGKKMDIFNEVANNSDAVKGDFDNGSGVSGGSGVLSGDGSGTASGDGDGDGDGNLQLGTGAGKDTGTTNDLLKDIKDGLEGDVTLPEKGSFDTSGLAQEITDLKSQITTLVSTIRSQASSLFTNTQSGAGSLYCERNIPIPLAGNSSATFDICLEDYREELSILGYFILAMSLISSVFIVLGRGN